MIWSGICDWPTWVSNLCPEMTLWSSPLAVSLPLGFQPEESKHGLFPAAMSVPGVPSQRLPAHVQAAALLSASLTWRPCHTEESGWPQHECAELSLCAGRPPRVPRVVTGCLPSWAPAHLEACP